MDKLAETISSTFVRWDDSRVEQKKNWKELRDFLYAVDTTKTSNSKLPWSNKTTLPKLTQIMENLIANYESALFPNEDWIKWEAGDYSSTLKDKASVVTAYTKSKLKSGGFREKILELLHDWVIYGNCFATVEYERKVVENPEDGTATVAFSGGKIRRISPYDIVFNPTATSFRESPKIVRYLKPLGDIALDAETKPELSYSREVVEKLYSDRSTFSASARRDKTELRRAFIADGYGSLDNYYQSGTVELLEFMGNIYDPDTKQIHKDLIITVVDRKHVLRVEQLPTWNNEEYIKHVGWRNRPDNLWCMSPLENLMGLQYRIDHLENLKADIMDMVAYPIPVLKGDVEWDGWIPGSEVILGDDGAIDILRVDSAALSYDNQIGLIEAKMEQYAGAPREAMGIRTAGEKTAYEVQQLQNAASRMFQSKINYFESMFLEPLVNQVFEVSRRNLDGADVIPVIDNELGILEFLTITKEDLKVKGNFYPRGARHFAEKARFVQEITQMLSTMPPDVTNHLSTKVIAKELAQQFNLDKLGAYQPNIRILEQLEAQQLLQAGQFQLEDAAAASVEDPMVM
jgi:hypothetical protein